MLKRTFPDKLIVFVDLTDTMEWDSLKTARIIAELKETTLSFWKENLVEGDAMNSALFSVEDAEFELALGKFFVPADAV